MELLEVDHPLEAAQQVVVVGHGEKRGAVLLGVVEEDLEDAALVGGVEIAGGLVGQQQLGLGDQRAAHGRPLLLALGEAVGEAAELVRHADSLGQRHRTLAHRWLQAQRRVDPVGQQHVVEHAQVLEQLELLEDQADVADAELPAPRVVEGGHLHALRHHATPLRRGDARDQVQQRGLARAARPDHRHLLTALHHKLGDEQCEVALAVTELEVRDLDDSVSGCGHGSVCLRLAARALPQLSEP